MRLRLSLLLLAIFAVTFGSSCFDPVHQDAVDALGPESGGVRTGPTHRPGQPCLTCHGGHGPATAEMSIGGTVFAVRGTTTGLSGVTVTITDLNGTAHTRVTNDAGNFYIFAQEWVPTYPLHVTIASGTDKKEMTTRVGGDGSCATCHRGPGDNAHMPGVFLRDK